MSKEHNVEKMQQRIKEAIIAAYPEDIFPTPLDVSHLKDNNAAYIMREMAGAVASIAKDTIEETLTSLHHSHTEKIGHAKREEREYALGIIEKYEAMPFAPTTFARIKASLTPNPHSS